MQRGSHLSMSHPISNHQWPEPCAESVSGLAFSICQPGNAIVGVAEPPAELAVDILHHHHIGVDVGLVVRIEVSGGELVQHGWGLRDDRG